MFFFHSFLSPTQSGQNGLSTTPPPDSLFLQTNTELIQIPSASTVRAPPASTENEFFGVKVNVKKPCSALTRLYWRSQSPNRRPPSPSNESHRGDTLVSESTAFAPPLLSKRSHAIGPPRCFSNAHARVIGWRCSHRSDVRRIF